jgi:Family of unknown function (DUF5906)
MGDNPEDEFTAQTSEPCPEGSGVTIDDFVAYMPAHTYIFKPCREPWPASSIDARLPRMTVLDSKGRPKQRNGKVVTIAASRWLDRNRSVEQMTWCPGLPTEIKDRLVVNAGWIEREGVTTFNLYREPRIKLGDDDKAGPWIEHVHQVYDDDDAHHIIQWLAHRVQRPQEKVNHALVMGGAMGIGKDSLLEPVRYAVGPWNFQDVSPTALLGRFNGFVKCVILRVNEARDLGEFDRFGFYDHTKIYTATPPDALRVDEKHLREHYVFNCLGFLITTNHKSDGIYLPADDRRHHVAWSGRSKEDFSPAYWNQLWGYYNSGGCSHVAAYLAEFDLTEFDPKAPPPKTEAFWDIVNANTAPEDAELADLLDRLNGPEAATIDQLTASATGDIGLWLMERKNRRAIPHRLERCGYVPVRNPLAKDGLWVVKGARRVVYAKATQSPEGRLKAARELANA